MIVSNYSALERQKLVKIHISIGTTAITILGMLYNLKIYNRDIGSD